MTSKTDPKPAARPLPADLAAVALGDINDVCTAVRMSSSWVHEETSAGRFPQPVIRQPRCTRWRLADIRAWLIDRAEKAATDTRPAELMSARAKKASIKAREPAAVAKAQATRKARIAAREGAAT